MKYIFCCLFAACSLSSFMNAKVYERPSYQVEFPDDWKDTKVDFSSDFRGYYLYGFQEFSIVNVSSEFIKGSDLQDIIDFLHEQEIQDGFKNWLRSRYEDTFQDISIDSVETLAINGRSSVSVKWTGKVKDEFLSSKMPGKKLYFLEYYIPDPHHWLKSYVISCESSRSNDLLEATFKRIAHSFLIAEKK